MKQDRATLFGPAALLRALISIARRPDSRLILQPVTEERPPFYDLRNDYDVMFRGKRVGRISFDHNPYDSERMAITSRIAARADWPPDRPAG